LEPNYDVMEDRRVIYIVGGMHVNRWRNINVIPEPIVIVMDRDVPIMYNLSYSQMHQRDHQ